MNFRYISLKNCVGFYNTLIQSLKIIQILKQNKKQKNNSSNGTFKVILLHPNDFQQSNQ